jgi:hypothetical protein
VTEGGKLTPVRSTRNPPPLFGSSTEPEKFIHPPGGAAPVLPNWLAEIELMAVIDG